MKKIALTAMLTLMMVLMLATIASAVEPYYHGDFASNSLGCGKCHVTHAANAKALLVAGPTQTDFCYYCHNGFLKSPYDAESGKIQTATETWASVAGGFVNSFDFDNTVYNAANGADGAKYIANTSKHGVETYDSNDWTTGTLIPGGTTNLTGTFRCGSCHDPHAGGAYDGATVMPRLLKKDLPTGADFDPATFGDWTFTAPGASSGGGFKTMVVTAYGADAGTWCAGCHDLFNQTAHDAGQAAVNSAATNNTNKYMHRMNFAVQADGVTYLGANNTIAKLPLSTGSVLTCLTCHRAHGTASVVTGNPTFIRANSYKKGTGAAAAATQASTVLLRQKDRDVCYNCHGAAVANTPALQVP